MVFGDGTMVLVLVWMVCCFGRVVLPDGLAEFIDGFVSFYDRCAAIGLV